MICVSLGGVSYESCLKILSKVDMAEIRMDRMKLVQNEIKNVFSFHPQLIATYRSGSAGEETRKKLLLAAIYSGAAYIDLEVNSKGSFIKEIIQEAKKKNCKLIISYHNFQMTPALADLIKMVNRCFAMGADIAKISCFVKFRRDNARLLSLLDDSRPVVVTGMGPLGRITRIAAHFCGSPITYVCWMKGRETAPGQLEVSEMEKIRRLISNG
ncbi:MAG: type I 3-dehydroquinate dehydratase [Candidatus Aminicenantales bacterium]